MKRMRVWQRSAVIGIGVTAIAAIIFSAVSPRLTVREIAVAAAGGDTETLNRLIDFSAVKTSLLDDVTDLIQRRAVQRVLVGGSDQSLARTASAQHVSRAVAERLLEQAVSPSSLSAAVQGFPVRLDGGWRSQERELTFLSAQVSGRYSSPLAYVVTVATNDGPFERYEVEFRRSGIFGWRATRADGTGPRIFRPEPPQAAYVPPASSPEVEPSPPVESESIDTPRMPDGVPEIAHGTPYAEARQTLIDGGWSPFPVLTGSGMPSGYPEQFNCSGTGMAYCEFIFYRSDAEISVGTYGEDHFFDGVGPLGSYQRRELGL